ncbi:hypothetical protein FMEXI_5458 [Fusarium mexicanum]|uniref:Methyltransferase n=1 Tax=Fusarium mexicanum TaxID=751941 RepID=A0A8H5N034_9HYPO|nr:hypothetical protein FMEXI_5458 [Fusarium mexicanum]
MASPAAQPTAARAESPPDVPGVLEAEDDGGDTDSTLDLGEGSSSYMTSLKSSIFSYRYEHGRRYHAFHEGAYLVPNDDEEQNRMDLVHHIYSLLLAGKLHTAPIDNPQRVLDLGTGTGIWAIDFAEVPTNCVFEVDDFEDPWVYKKPFDYIHSRELEGCIGNEQQFFDRAFENLNSGGYLELQAQRGFFMSDDDSIKKAVNAEVWAEAVRDSSSKFGKPIDCAMNWKDKVIKAGFVDVHEEVRKVKFIPDEKPCRWLIMRQIPIGAWPKDPVLKEVGKCQVVQSCAAIDSYTPMLLEKLVVIALIQSISSPKPVIFTLDLEATAKLRSDALGMRKPAHPNQPPSPSLSYKWVALNLMESYLLEAGGSHPQAPSANSRLLSSRQKGSPTYYYLRNIYLPTVAADSSDLQHEFHNINAMDENHEEAPASYDDIGVGDANPEVQKCVNRIYHASGKYPWDWLPRDYVPKVAAWGTNAARNLAVAVEAVHAPGSTVSMEELREFLVRKAKERQEVSKNGKPVKPTMNSDCAKARKWIEDNMVNSQSTSEQNKRKRSAHDGSSRKARPSTWRGLTIAQKKQPQDKLDDDDDHEDDNDPFPVIDFSREMSVLSDISNVSSAIGPSDRPQHSPQPPPPPDRTWTQKRDIPPPPSPVPSKRSRQVEQFLSSNIDDTNGASSLVDADAEEEACLRQGETMMFYAINRSLRTACEKIDAAGFWSNVYSQEIHSTRMNLAAIDMEVRHVLQKATRDRDEKQEKVRQLGEEKKTLSTVIENQGGKCSDTLQAMYDGFILEYENAQKELKNAQNTLEAIEEESQKNKQHQDGQDKIASLEKDIAKQEEIIKRATRRKLALETVRCNVDLDKFLSAPYEVLCQYHEAAMKRQENLS